MKKILFITLCLLVNTMLAQTGLEGVWATGEANTQVAIEQTGEELLGKIIASDNPKATIGKVIIKDVKKKGDTYNAKLYAAKKKKWLDVELTPLKEKLELEVSLGFLSKTIEWNRVE